MARPIKKRANIVSDVLNSDLHATIEEIRPNVLSDVSSGVFKDSEKNIHDLISENEIYETSNTEEISRLLTKIEEADSRYLELLTERDSILEENLKLKEIINNLKLEIKTSSENLYKKDIDIAHLEVQLASEKTFKNNTVTTINSQPSEYNINNSSYPDQSMKPRRRKIIDQSKLEGYDSWN